MATLSLKMSYCVMGRWDGMDGPLESNGYMECLKRFNPGILCFSDQCQRGTYGLRLIHILVWPARIITVLIITHPYPSHMLSIMIKVIFYFIILSKDSVQKEKLVMSIVQWKRWFCMLYRYRLVPF